MNDEHLVIVTADASQTIIFIFFICHFRYITCFFLSKAVQQLQFDQMGEVHHLVTDNNSP